MSIELHFTEDDWARIAADWSAWWAGELPRPLVMIQGWQPAPGAARPGAPWFINHLPCDMPADQVIDIYQTDLEATRCYGDAWPKWWPNLGPGIIAAFLGSEVCAGPDTVWFEPIAAAGIADLRLAYNGGNAWWQRVRWTLRMRSPAFWARSRDCGCATTTSCMRSSHRPAAGRRPGPPSGPRVAATCSRATSPT
ncbi:MAG: hypothetical protein CVU38_18450 [Chloroflexi bacterium HGW-Chloroflexi-1]|nr:MAG: hypothetical protein CVU38_18450 [Chloroflexi bacterium HGW-Chloroflexi-1]